MPRLSLHPGYSGGLLIMLAAVACVLVAIFYRRAFRSLPLAQWAVLYGLRVAAILCVLLLLFRPVLSFQRQITERRAVIFVLDASKSMTIADDASGGSRLEQARAKVASWASQLSDDFQIQLLAFSETAHEVKPQQLAALEAEGAGTSLARALQAAGRLARPGQTEAIFLVSDGVHNAQGNPTKAAAELTVPVHTVGVGSVSRDRGTHRDIRLVELECPPQLSLQNKSRIQASVDAVGFPGRVATVTLSEDDRQVAEQTLALDDTPGAQVVTFEFTPQTKGLHTYAAKVLPPPDEKIVENNQRSRSALVVDSRIRVLYLEGTLRAEYGAIVGRFLSKDPNVEFCALVQTRPNVFVQRTNMSDLSLTSIPDKAEQFERFDVFILGDLDRSYFRDAQLELLRQRVRDGAGLVMLGGYHSLGPGGYAWTPLDEVLPVVAGGREIGQVGEPFLPVLTLDGRQHAIFANIQPFFPSEKRAAEIEGLPPLEGCVRVAGVAPGATVLAAHPTETAGGMPLPILAVQSVGKGRAAVFTADTTRNWQQALRTLDRESPFLRFWGQLVRWLASRTDPLAAEAGIVATIDNTYYEPDQPVTISAVVRGKEGEAAERAAVAATITLPNGTTESVTLAAVPGPAGNFRAVFEPVFFGRYELRIDAALEGQKLQSEKLAFDVGRPNLEFDLLDLDDKLLSEISSFTGGQYAHLSTADRLIQRLERRLERRRVEYEVGLAWPPLVWLLFASVLTIEWLVRRSHSLR